MPTCQNCGKENLARKFLRYLDHYGDDFSELDNYFQGTEEDNACSCHSCPIEHCSTRILAKEKYCAKHTVSYNLSQCRCEGTDWLGKKTYFCSQKVITSEGYCYLHENKCAECSERVDGRDKYCFKHWNGYCKVIDCHQQTPNSRDSNHYIYCEQHAKLYGNSLSNYQNIQQEKTQRKQQKETEQTKLKSLVKANTTITGEIKEVERFSPWFNPNCATVIAEHGNYLVYLVVYEPAKEKMEKIIAPIKIEGNYTSFSSAQGKATNLRANLQNSANPILEVFPNADSWNSFSSIVSWPYVKKENLPVGYIYPPQTYFSSDDMIGGSDRLIFNDTAGENMPIANYLHGQSPDKYIKPGDIVWVLRKQVASYYHVCVYLGNEKVCHISGDNKGAKIESWRNFIQDPIISLSGGELIRFHPIIPFKDYRDIVKQLVWAKDNKFQQGNYNLQNRNCEHFANMAVLGINFSKQIEDKGKTINNTETIIRWATSIARMYGHSFPVVNNSELNNGNTSINLSNELSRTNGLCQKSDSETERYERQCLQEIPSYIPTDSCRIM